MYHSIYCFMAFRNTGLFGKTAIGKPNHISDMSAALSHTCPTIRSSIC